MTPEEAKQQLREVVRDHSPTGWVRRHPLEALGLGVFLGAVFGSAPEVGRATVGNLLRLVSKCR